MEIIMKKESDENVKVLELDETVLKSVSAGSGETNEASEIECSV